MSVIYNMHDFVVYMSIICVKQNLCKFMGMKSILLKFSKSNGTAVKRFILEISQAAFWIWEFCLYTFVVYLGENSNWLGLMSGKSNIIYSKIVSHDFSSKFNLRFLLFNRLKRTVLKMLLKILGISAAHHHCRIKYNIQEQQIQRAPLLTRPPVFQILF